MDQFRQDALLKEYGEVSNNFRLLTDIRFKLLAFIPIATVAAMSDKILGLHGFVLSLFGLVITIGLSIYNKRNDQLYDELIGRASEIERTLGLPDGSFANRPRPWLTIKILGMEFKIDHRTGVGIIYTASITLWLYGCYLPVIELGQQFYLSLAEISALSKTDSVTCKYLVAFALALLSMSFALSNIKRQSETRQRRMRELAASAIDQLETLDITKAAADTEFIETCVELAGINKDKMDTIRARASFYGSLDKKSLLHYMPTEPKAQSMSHFVSLLTDLPPRWIYDCSTNRREAVKPERTKKHAD